MSAAEQNIDPAEIAKFDSLASRWWDPDGDFRPLHQINPLRLDYIRQRAPLDGSQVLDVGCGGGILTEAMAGNGARVTGIDMAEKPLGVARLHQAESGTDVEYLQTTAEELSARRPAAFDVVTVIEACARLVRPGGDIFFSTINRNPKSFLFAIVGAEYVLNLLPRGTHEYEKFIRPSELDEWARQAGLEVQDSVGLHYNPLTRAYWLAPNVDVNYLMHYHRPGDD
jgi:2-polyprenyl-6-hydroxyphenyl methylase/3-demethylubiquinone-9 3-methyltransferase